MNQNKKSQPHLILAAVAIWAITRLLMAALWAAKETFIENDVRYYESQLTSKGLLEALIEYPTPIPVGLEILRTTLAVDQNSFLLLFAILMVIADGFTTVWLWLRVGHTAAWYWMTFIAVIGSLAWFRIDLIPAIAVVFALGWLNRRPTAAGAAIAIGAATKLWPALLIAPMLGKGRKAKYRGFGFAIMGLALGLASLVGFGFKRSISPLTWQSERGLQIESIPATVPMLQHAFNPGVYKTELSQYNAFEIYGPGVAFWQHLGDILMIVAMIFTAVLVWLIAANGYGLQQRTLAHCDDSEISTARTHAIVLATTAIIYAMIVANKTFSPQYMIWLAGPLSVLVNMRLSRHDQLWARGLALLGLICAAATHHIFPLNYSGVISVPSDPMTTIILAARNLAVLALTILVSYRAVVVGLRLGAISAKPSA